ncbi:MAG: universal stress protein [Planctomycetota bacterium]
MARRLHVKEILLLVDSSDAARDAAEYAVELGHDFGARLVACSTVDTATLKTLALSRILVPVEVSELERDLEASSRKYLTLVADLAARNKVKAETLLLKGAVHSAVLATQKERKSDLIVMGAVNSHQARRDLVIRERQLILDESPCPVICVRF